MNAASEFGPTMRQSSPKHDYHHQSDPNATMEYQHYGGGSGGGAGSIGGQQQQQQQQQDLTIDGIPNNFPHRRSRASRTFKNPPQPHMCIKEKTLDGKEVFINVLSWTRIANPDNPDAPIPLYGGMKVGKIPSGSPKVPPLVYAVMASPEVLKKAGRKCPDTPERMNLVDLMCEFVEAMNPALHLSKKPEILKDRDLSGELKDVWSAVQACRDKGRSDNGPPENLVVYTEFGPDSAPSYEQTIQQHQQQLEQYCQQQEQQDSHSNLLEQQQQQQQQYYQSMFPQQHSHEIQSAINSHISEVRAMMEQRSSAMASGAPDGPAADGINGNTATSKPPAAVASPAGNCSNQPGNSDEDLLKETESLKLSSGGSFGRTNGLALPADGTNASTATATTATASLTSSSSSTVPQTQTSPATPVAMNTTATTTAPAKEPTKSSTGHTFFPMFRSSKSSNSSSSASGSSNSNGSGNGAANTQQNPSTGSDRGTTVNGESANSAGDGGESPKTTKPVSKKSGLYFFRRNKSSTSSSTATDGGSKKVEPSTPTKQPLAGGVGLPAGISSATSAPATPAATGAAFNGPDAKLIYQYPDQYNLDGGANGSGAGVGGSVGGSSGAADIIETASSTTIVAK